MMVMMPVPGMRLIEVAFRAATGLVLHLHRRVVDLIMLFEEVMDPIEQRIVVMRRDHLHV